MTEYCDECGSDTCCPKAYDEGWDDGTEDVRSARTAIETASNHMRALVHSMDISEERRAKHLRAIDLVDKLIGDEPAPEM